jgi:hypothetical protein
MSSPKAIICSLLSLPSKTATELRDLRMMLGFVFEIIVKISRYCCFGGNHGIEVFEFAIHESDVLM